MEHRVQFRNFFPSRRISIVRSLKTADTMHVDRKRGICNEILLAMNVLFEKQINQTLYREIEPHPDLRSSIDCFWMMDTRDNDLSHRVVPDGCTDILFEWTPFGARCRVVGPLTRHIRKCYNLPTRVLGVRIAPGGAQDYFEQPICLLKNQACRIDRLWRDCRPVASILESSGIDEQAISELNSLLLGKQKTQIGQSGNLGKKVISEILENPAEVAINGIGMRLERSRQQITRAVKSVSGISPKKLARILRFYSLVSHLRTNQKLTSWASLAVDFGFYDQAHLIREFRYFAGTTPGKFVTEQTSV